MKKFDRKRASAVSNDLQKGKRGSLFDRMSKKIENARDFIRQKTIESKFEDSNDEEVFDKTETPKGLDQSNPRQTVVDKK